MLAHVSVTVSEIAVAEPFCDAIMTAAWCGQCRHCEAALRCARKDSLLHERFGAVALIGANGSLVRLG